MPQLPLPMIAPTGLYSNVPTLSPEEAGERVAQIAMNTSFRMFPDSTAAKDAKTGDKPVKQQLLPQAVAMQQMMRGIHF